MTAGRPSPDSTRAGTSASRSAPGAQASKARAIGSATSLEPLPASGPLSPGMGARSRGLDRVSRVRIVASLPC
jgi:hypothetical protein